jgi:hypothetical protein
LVNDVLDAGGQRRAPQGGLRDDAEAFDGIVEHALETTGQLAQLLTDVVHRRERDEQP